MKPTREQIACAVAEAIFVTGITGSNTTAPMVIGNAIADAIVAERVEPVEAAPGIDLNEVFKPFFDGLKSRQAPAQPAEPEAAEAPTSCAGCKYTHNPANSERCSSCIAPNSIHRLKYEPEAADEAYRDPSNIAPAESGVVADYNELANRVNKVLALDPDREYDDLDRAQRILRGEPTERHADEQQPEARP